MNNKKTVMLYATCQGDMIKNVLNSIKEFNTQYEIKENVHNYTLIRNNRDYMEHFSDRHKSADIWIYQPLDTQYGNNSTDFLMQYLKDSAQTISLTYVYNHSFWPLVPAGTVDVSDDFTISNVERIKNQEVIQDLVLAGYSKNDILNMYNSNAINWKYQDRYEQCRQIQMLKEKKTHVKVQDYIDANLRIKKLFWYPSHPTHYIIFHIVNQILKILNLEPVIVPDDDAKHDTSPLIKIPYTLDAKQHFKFEWKHDDGAHEYFKPYLERILK